MRDITQETSLLLVNFAKKVLYQLPIKIDMREPTQGKKHTSVIFVKKVFFVIID